MDEAVVLILAVQSNNTSRQPERIIKALGGLDESKYIAVHGDSGAYSSIRIISSSRTNTNKN